MKDIADVIVLKTTARLSNEDIRDIFESHDDYEDFPEDCFLRTLYEAIDTDEEEEKVCEPCDITLDDDSVFCKLCGTKLSPKEENDEIGFNLAWCGEDSGKSFQNVFVKKVVPKIAGRLEALLLLQTPDDQPFKLMGIVVEDGTYKSYDATVQFSPWPTRSSQEDPNHL